jgi:hypothetical protein
MTSSEMLRRVISQKLNDVSEILTASITRASFRTTEHHIRQLSPLNMKNYTRLCSVLERNSINIFQS